MNIATGGGTLVHEIVHPYVEADFPNAPPWLNEGLGSLFEQSDERDGKIVGLTNWRLAGLQKAIKRGGVPSFFELTHMDSKTFYLEEHGTNYSQSRYLMYYLQEKGLLHDFYRRFRAARGKAQASRGRRQFLYLQGGRCCLRPHAFPKRMRAYRKKSQRPYLHDGRGTFPLLAAANKAAELRDRR